MKTGILLILIVASSLLMPESAKAADFDPVASPSVFSAGTENSLFNFSITNNDAGNKITKMNITLNYGFSYAGGARHDTAIFNLLEGGMVLSWENSTYLVSESSTSYYWFYANVPQQLGQMQVNVSTVDNAGAFLSKNATIELIDVTPPTWSNNVTFHSIPTAYSLNKNHTLNITWADNMGVEEIKFEWSGVNYTNTSSNPVIAVGSGVYGITMYDLSANQYAYRWFAKDTNNTENVTGTLLYEVSRADNPISVYFDGSMDTNRMANLGETLNITVTGKGTVYLFENGTLIGSGGSPLTYFKSLSSIRDYSYQVNGTATSNYTTNSTGATYKVYTRYPPPKYTLSTSIPSTWYSNALALFNVSWEDANDANGFSVALIELNHTGTATNYTMTRIGSTNTSTYQLNFSSPMSLSWKIYANNSYGTWNSTALTISTISKLAPSLEMSILPSQDVIKGTQTTAYCYSNQVSVGLYRNGILVSNPDIQTLSTGEHFYLCNNTVTADYSSAYVSGLLTVYNFMADVSFIEVEPVVPVVRNSSNTTIVVVKNSGNATQYLTFGLENLTSVWYSINSTSANVERGNKVAFLINFTVDSSTNLGEYAGVYKITTSDNSYTSSFYLRVVPDKDEYETIGNSVALHRLKLNNIWNDLNITRLNRPELNFTSVEQKILQAKAKLDLASQHVNDGNYYGAYALLSEIETLVASAETELNATKLGAGILPSWMDISLKVIGVIVVIVLGYLLWPEPGYNVKSGKYVHQTPKQKGLEKLKEMKLKVKDNLPVGSIEKVKETAWSGNRPASRKVPNEVEIAAIAPSSRLAYKETDVRKTTDIKKTVYGTLDKLRSLFKRKKDSKNYVEIEFDENEEKE